MNLLDEVWHHLEEAPGYFVSSKGRVRRGVGSGRDVRIRRNICGRKYANLIVKGRAKKFYIHKLKHRYF